MIVGALATLIVPNYQRTIEKTRVKEAQGSLAILFRAEQMYKLANQSYGTFNQLVSGTYLDPNPNSAQWSYSTSSADFSVGFTATATRQAGAGQTVKLDQNWTGNPINDTGAGGPYQGKTFFGDHPLHD